VLEALKALDIDDVVLVVGGIVPDPARAELNGMGVPGVFTPGTSLTEIVKFIESSVKLDRDYGEKQ
jgi:methylmalonyl-CoA mutase C-terminal domain/subunit